MTKASVRSRLEATHLCRSRAWSDRSSARAHALVVAFVVGAAACGSSEDPIAGPADGGASTSADASGANDGGVNASDGNGGDGGLVDGGGGEGSSTCLSPHAVTLPFATDDAASTATLLDVAVMTCNTQTEKAFPEAVYRLVLDAPTKVAITASDRSGSGVGVQVRDGSCTGTSVSCDWDNGGNVKRTLDLPAGTWLFLVERSPAGRFSFALATP